MMTRSGSTMRSRILAEMYSGCLLKHGAQRLEYFLHRLMKFRLGRVFGLYLRHNFVDVAPGVLIPGVVVIPALMWVYPPKLRYRFVKAFVLFQNLLLTYRYLVPAAGEN